MNRWKGFNVNFTIIYLTSHALKDKNSGHLTYNMGNRP